MRNNSAKTEEIAIAGSGLAAMSLLFAMIKDKAQAIENGTSQKHTRITVISPDIAGFLDTGDGKTVATQGTRRSTPLENRHPDWGKNVPISMQKIRKIAQQVGRKAADGSILDPYNQVPSLVIGSDDAAVRDSLKNQAAYLRKFFSQPELAGVFPEAELNELKKTDPRKCLFF